MEPRLAVIWVFPAARPVANPAELIVATAGFEEVHVTSDVTITEPPEAGVPKAPNCSCAPAGIDGDVGCTVMDVQSMEEDDFEFPPHDGSSVAINTNTMESRRSKGSAQVRTHTRRMLRFSRFPV